MQSFSPTKDFIESLISTELKEDVNIVMVFKEMLKPHDVFVLQGSVNFDLGKKLEWKRLTFVLARLLVKEDFVISLEAY